MHLNHSSISQPHPGSVQKQITYGTCLAYILQSIPVSM
uniref:Uncharacterized protein n=1 Tax=Anguilla anguilla TaxID=7936 RepID=A0A0E9X2I6_ANGAN